MNRIVVGIQTTVCASLLAVQAHGAIFLEDSFAYATGGVGGQGAWNSGSACQVASGSLAVAGLESPTVTSNKASLVSSAGTALKSFNGSSVTSGSVYLSFILRQTTLSASTTGGTVAGLDDDGSVSTSNGRVASALGVHIKQTNTTTYVVGIRKAQGSSGAGGGTDLFYTGDSFVTGETVFIVAKYTFNPGAGDDTVALWVNPATNSFGGIEPVASIAATNSGNTTDASQLQHVLLRANSSASSGINEIDDLRVGNTWADVTPADGMIQPPATNSSQPVITQALLLPSGFVLRGTNGTSNGVFRVLSSTVLTAAFSNWPAVATNTFDATGNFDHTNPVSPLDAQRFYRLLVGGQIAPPPVAPNIATQPTNLTVTAGQPASFFVAATGTAPLSYQWRYNTNTPLAAATNTTFTIPFTTTNDSGGYSVVVTNVAGAVTSVVAVLTVNPAPVAPTITTQPTNITVLAGQNAAFFAAATGTAPLAYQWFFNTNTPIASATNTAFTVANAQDANEGVYSVRVTNSAGSVTSVVATLTVNTPPSITGQPQSQTVTVSNGVSFTVTAAGDATLRYQWYFNTNSPILNATNATYSIATVLTNNAGNYSVTVTNDFGNTNSAFATLTVNPPSTNSADFNLYGFGAPTAGGGIIPETDPNYRKVYNAGDFRLALANNATKVIEIMNDLNLGWNEIGATNQTSPFRQSTAPSMHPVLIASGITTIDIQNKNGITIFSANGATIKHAEFNVKRTHNILIRNLKFDELWEWDEATKGDYDSKDWDFITIGDGDNCTNVWIDHCDFTKSYDGTVDLKGGANQVTVSWCRFLADDGGPNSFVRRQFNHLETNGVAEAMFDLLRTGFSIDDLVAVARSQKKGHLAGPTELDSDNNDIKLTLHHNYYYNHQDRLPRLRGGNAHVYNCYVNNAEARAAKILRDNRVSAMGGIGSYKFDVTLNGAISTEDGAVLVEKCHFIDLSSPLRNNQVSASNPTYTGKIRAEDTINTQNGSTFRGDTEDAGSTLVPVPAPLKPFSWNGFASLPYSYPLDDPANVSGLVTNLAGKGVINWNKTNWFKTTY